MFITFTTNSTVRADGWDAWYLASPVGINQDANAADFSVYPNPATDEVIINYPKFSDKDLEINILNCLSKIVCTKTDFSTQENSTVVDVSNLTSGMYFISIKNENISLVKKLIIHR
jgi:hypothetical protein